MSYVSVGIAGAGLLTKGITSLVQANRAKKSLAQLNKTPYPEYQISPELQSSYSRAQSMANQGYTAQETAAFNQNLSRNQATQFRTAIDQSGGNLARAINAGLQANNIGAINQFASSDAQIRRQNIRNADDLARALQSQKNLSVSSALQRRNQLEQAYGSALAQQRENLAGTLGDVTSFGIEASNLFKK